jgi:glycosyltransferase involved in cell wall biosynthesis
VGYRLLARRVAATIYQSDFIERESKAEGVRYGGRSFRIPNGFDTGLFVQNETDAAAFRNRFGLDGNAMVVLTAGKLVPEKRVDRGVQALARVRLGSRGLIYVLCGDGPDEPRLRELADREGLRLLITGMIDQKSLRGAYSAADLVLHTGKEIFGNVVGEAMSCGRTVICTQEGAAPEVVGEAGILIRPNDNEALTSSVTSLLEDPARRALIGAAARRRIEEVFPLQRMISGYEDMLATVLAAR